MAAIPDLANRELFPAFSDIIEEDESSNGSETSDNSNDTNVFLLAQIKDDMTITKPTLVLVDRDNHPFALIFEGYGRDDLDLAARGLRKGTTVIVSNARRIVPNSGDGSSQRRPFVRVRDPDTVQVVAATSLDQVVSAATRLRQGGLEAACEACGKAATETKLLRCTGCGQAWYCNRVGFGALVVYVARRRLCLVFFFSTMVYDLNKPVRLAPLKYVTVDASNSKGGPKNGHLSALDPTFAEVKPACDAAVAGLWSADNWDLFRKNWLAPPPSLPSDCPQTGRDVTESYQNIPTRDGGSIELKIMESAKSNNNTKKTCVLRMHGGGWAVGWHGTETVENLHAASHPDVVLVSIDYRLAPHYPYPIPLNDCVDALRWVKANAASLSIDPERIVLLGGSAGSNLAICLALKAKAEHIPGIIGMILDWPVGAHPTFFPQLRRQGYELESYAQNVDATVVSAAKMELFLDAYLQDDVILPDPYHSPLLADSFQGLPPALVQVGGYDPLRDEGIAIAEKLQKDGVPVHLHVYPGLPHCFPMVVPDLPQSKTFQQRQNDFLDNLIKSKVSKL